jgi:hypothetical protein
MRLASAKHVLRLHKARDARHVLLGLLHQPQVLRISSWLAVPAPTDTVRFARSIHSVGLTVTQSLRSLNAFPSPGT